MTSLDVNSLFTKVPFDESIEICVNELFKFNQTVSVLNKQRVLEMLSLTTKEKIILFDQKYYSQLDGVAIGSSLGPTLTNIFLCYHETTWLKDCPKSFKQVYYKRDKNIEFSFETEKENSFFSMLRFVEKKINLQHVFLGKIHSVVYTLILVAL